jgi:hypothetical protein
MPVGALVPIPKSELAHNWNVGVLENNNTSRLLFPSMYASLRLFLEACKKSISDHQTGISVCISSHTTFFAIHKWSTIGIALCFLSLCITSHHAPTASAFTAGVPRTYPTGENTSIIGFVLSIVENTAFHPIGTFLIPSPTVLAFGRFEIPKMLKDEGHSSTIRWTCSKFRHN